MSLHNKTNVQKMNVRTETVVLFVGDENAAPCLIALECHNNIIITKNKSPIENC
jgi:hypothetical protein